MTDSELELMRDYLDGRLSEDKVDTLNQLLETNHEARSTFKRMATLEEGLNNLYASPLTDPNLFNSTHQSKAKPYRSFISAAAGLCFGILSTIFINSYLNASNSTLVEPETIFMESFENGEKTVVTGPPKQAGVWSGDYSSIVSSEQGIKAHEGDKMLKFLRGDHEGKANAIGYVSEVYRLFDVRAYKQKINNGDQMVYVSANFNSRAFEGPKHFPCSVTIYAFEEYRSLNSKDVVSPYQLEHEQSASSHKNMYLSQRGGTWQSLNNELSLPANTNFILIKLAISDLTQHKATTSISFDAHYLDSVTLNLLSRPIL